MHILITNDDGILAPGIEALYRAVADLGHVDVVAPETTQSAMGHAITVQTPMSVRRVHVNSAFHGWSVDGRPADCVKLALFELLDKKPDFVLSGINAGVNTGNYILYSGTVAGALEGAICGVPSMAFSLELSEELDFHRAGRVAREVFLQYAASRPALGTCLSVNIPALDRGWPRGVRVCPQGTVELQDAYQKRTDEHGRSIYWLDSKLPMSNLCPKSDFSAILERYVSITPLRFDMTDHAALPRVTGWQWPQEFEPRTVLE